MTKGPIESILRPIYEFDIVFVSFICSFCIVYFHNILLLTYNVSLVIAAVILSVGFVRLFEGLKIYSYQRGLIVMQYYSLAPSEIPVKNNSLFLGKGFAWTQQHTQRIYDLKHDKNKKYITPSRLFLLIRHLEVKYEIFSMFNNNNFINPFKPLPPIGGNSIIHAVGGLEGERNIYLDIRERVAHTLVIGTTRVGKSRLAEILITQDIRRGDTTIVFDPKGDADLMMTTYVEAKKAKRSVYILHLGYPDISCRYNAIGAFTKVTEVAGRISDQLPSEGTAVTFKDFAWGFINIVSAALVKAGEKPDFKKMSKYINNIDPLIKLYKKKVLMKEYPDIDQTLKLLQDKYLTDKEGKVKYPPGGKDRECFLIDKWKQDYSIDDKALDGILTVFRYDRTYYDKLVAGLRPLLDKLTSGEVAEILSPSDDVTNKQPIIDWEQIIRQNAVVYIGLDALSDATVAHAVGAAMFADLTSLAGKLYKHGGEHGLPADKNKEKQQPKISIHMDEFNELIGDSFIPMVNKAGGAGYQITAYTQSAADIEAGIGSKPKASIVFDNFNNIIMLRVKSLETAEKLTNQIPEYSVTDFTIMAQATDSSTPESDTDFVSVIREQITNKDMPAISPDTIISLPKGQAFCLINGGQLYKIRIPLPKKDKKIKGIPNTLEQMQLDMRKKYHSEMNLNSIPTIN